MHKPGDRIFRPPGYGSRTWHILVPGLPRPRSGPLSSLILIYGFIGLIILGTVLLILPIANKSSQCTLPVNALFTATSAVCVTGLVVVDTADYWSVFGQAVILVLIQIGGFGFMTSATLFLQAFRRRIGLRERLLIRESMGLSSLGGLIKIVRRMALFTFMVELSGALLFFTYFCRTMPIAKAIWVSVFQSVSAFNNAGFDLFGSYLSLSEFYNVPLVIMVTAILIILGGISFVLISDITRNHRWVKLSLDSKLIITTTISLLVLGMLAILFTEYNDSNTLGQMSIGEKLLNAFFQSVTARTAGFSTINIAYLADYALFFLILLMFIGGASGSTAGGIKVNTLGLLVATIWSQIKGKEHAGAFEREFHIQQVYRALAIIMISIGLIGLVLFLLTITERFDFLSLFFETVSAFGTVGLTTGITPGLTAPGRILIMLTMFAGRLGPLALALALTQGQKTATYQYPEESIRIG